MIEFIENGQARHQEHRRKYTEQFKTEADRCVINFPTDKTLKFTKATDLINELIIDECKDLIDLINLLFDIRASFEDSIEFKEWLQTLPSYSNLLSQCAPYVLEDDGDSNYYTLKWYNKSKEEPEWLKEQRSSV